MAVAVGARSLDVGHLGSHVPDVRLKRDGLPHAVAVTTAEVTDRKGALQALGRCRSPGAASCTP